MAAGKVGTYESAGTASGGMLDGLLLEVFGPELGA